MAFSIIGLFRCTEVGMVGAYIMLVRHGFISPGLFVLSGINSEMVHSRKIKVMSDGVRAAPSLGFFWLVIIIANLGVPPCPVIIREVLSVVCVIALYPWVFVLLLMYFILSGAYRFSLYCQLTRTKKKIKIKVFFNEVTLKDIRALYFLFYPLAEVLFKWDLWAMM